MKQAAIIEELRNLLDRAGLAHRVVAEEHLEITPSYLSQIFNGERAPSGRVIKRMIQLRDKLKKSGLVAV